MVVVVAWITKRVGSLGATLVQQNWPVALLADNGGFPVKVFHLGLGFGARYRRLLLGRIEHTLAQLALFVAGHEHNMGWPSLP